MLLGRDLFFDKELSGPRDTLCATCHQMTLAGADGRSLSIDVGGSGVGPDRDHPEHVRIPRNAPPVFNLHAMDVMFWDGRVVAHGDGTFTTPAGSQLPAADQAVFTSGIAGVQAMFPVTSPEEMRGIGDEPDNELGALDADDFTGIWAGLMDRLLAIEGYQDAFAAAYPGVPTEDLTFAHAANAIGAFEVTVFQSTGSPWERFLAGDSTALTSQQIVGAEIFFEVGCADCHTGPGLTDLDFHNSMLPQFGPGKGDGLLEDNDWGRARETGQLDDGFAFRTPPLTNIALTAPYGHTGQYATLEAHIEHYVDPLDSLLTYDIEAEVADSVL